MSRAIPDDDTNQSRRFSVEFKWLIVLPAPQLVGIMLCKAPPYCCRIRRPSSLLSSLWWLFVEREVVVYLENALS